MDNLQSLAQILLAPATLLLVGRWIIGSLSKIQVDLQAIMQVLNGWEETEGLIVRVSKNETRLIELEHRINRYDL